MFVLKKLFELRDKTQQAEDEKPFLEHLEDLRIVITRVVLTLVIAMGFCFAFRNDLMDVIRAPIEKVWVNSQADKMPDPEKTSFAIDLNTWELAKKADRDTTNFTEAQKEYYFNYQDKNGSLHLKFHTDCVPYYRVAMEIDKAGGDGETFIKNLPDLPPEKSKQVLALMEDEKRPDAAVDSRGKLVKMQALNPTEGFMLSIKLSLFAGIIISFPLLLFFTLQFILPGLRKNEKKALWPAMAIGFGLFLTGVLFSYFYVLPKVLDFFYVYSQEMGVDNEWRIGYYISFATQFTLIFGLSFELPVVVMTMVKLGILNYEIMKNTRSYAILAIVIIAALITPTPDAFTLLLLAGPMIVLYEICIWLAFFHNKKQREADLAEQKELESKMISAPANTASRDDDDDGDDDDDPDDDGPDGDHSDTSREDYFTGNEEYEFHDDQDTDHYSYDDSQPYPIDDDIHSDDEGDEEDNGTYDFSEEELEKEYSHDDPPLDGGDPDEEHFYDDLDDDFEAIDSSPDTPSQSQEKEDGEKDKKPDKEEVKDSEDPEKEKDDEDEEEVEETSTKPKRIYPPEPDKDSEDKNPDDGSSN